MGKSLGYLVPALRSGRRVVVTTATKALQDQLADKDLPFLEEHLGSDFDWAVLKGRSNYLCLQRLREQQSAKAGQLDLEDVSPITRAEIAKLATWSGTTASGDQAELDWAPSVAAWTAVSVSSEECPGAQRCPVGSACFAELARAKAQATDLIVVNTHLYGLHVASNGVLLPEHDVVVVDEAHQLEDIMSDTVGVSITPGRVVRTAAAVRRVLEDPEILAKLLDTAPSLRDVLAGRVGERLGRPLPDPIADALNEVRDRCDRALDALRSISTTVEDVKQKVLRAQQLAGRLMEHIDIAIAHNESAVAFVSGSAEHPELEVAPLDVGPVLREGVWTKCTAILTSATMPQGLAGRVGLPDDGVTELSVDSPFDHEHHGLIYCAMSLPDVRNQDYSARMHEELAALIEAAGGRTLALFTSYRAMQAAADAVAPRIPQKVMTQRDLPKSALVAEFTSSESTCLFATAGFFQGVDIPGRTLSLVTIDRLPFPRPDDPLLSARRERLGANAFGIIDLPRASMLLAQAAGRLIRTRTDRGVVAVFDRRLGTAPYRWQLVNALPPMKRTRHREEAEAFLREITSE
ncbi:MAG: ATP-dependent DNA helicase [Ilumatobacteraceae bacterium]